MRAPLMPIASQNHSQDPLLQTNDKLGSGHTLLELVEGALQTFQALADDSSLRHWLEASVLERLWQVIFIYCF